MKKITLLSALVILFATFSFAQQNSNPNTSSSNWTFIGPSVTPSGGGGAGRINCIAIDPTNSSVIWVGAACGGLWKSTDGGATWSSNTDALPALSISDIVIDPSNTQNMYIATGDKYGINYQEHTWGQYSVGILKSTDGGATWATTGMTYTLANKNLIQRLIIDPANTNELFAATSNGIFKTTNAGTTWNNVQPGFYYDIEFQPGIDSVIYAGDSTGFLRSVNSGATWNYISGVTSTGRTSIAVSAANANVVYVWSQGGGFYYSSNSGTTFITRNDPSFAAQPYGYYDKVLEVSQTNANVLFAGGLLVARSTNGGVNWSTTSSNIYPSTNYVHSNNHALQFLPGSSTTIFSANDGGLFTSTNQGSAWNDLSNGINIKQYYRIGSSFLSPNLIYAGAEGNGTDKFTAPNAVTKVTDSEGMECLVDFTNDNTVFASSEAGSFYKSTDGGLTFNGMNQTGCDWTSPLIMDPSNHNMMYLGGTDVFQSMNNGNNWSNITNGTLDGTCIHSLEICQSTPSYVYAATLKHIYRTTDGGMSWGNITGNLPVSLGAISGITISSANPDEAWVTFSGFSSGNKVFYTADGGLFWANYSGTLPNIPINCIEYQDGSNRILYLGTDLGIFYRDATMSDWAPFNTGLPNVIVDELEIEYPTGKLRAATYGRGLWESDLQATTVFNTDASAYSMVYLPLSTCDSTLAPIVQIRNNGSAYLTSVDLHYRMDTQPWQMMTWTGGLSYNTTANVTLPSFIVGPGPHTFEAYTSNPNTTTDQNPYNDTIVRHFTELTTFPGTAVPPPIFEGFVNTAFPPVNWALENSTGLWSRNTTVGGYGLSTESAKADFFGIASGSDKIITEYVDFTNTVAPIRLYFDVAYAQYNTTYIDTLAIDLFSDCSGSTPRVYEKDGATLATAPINTSAYTPAPTEWRTDTVNLDSMAGHAPMQIRFFAISGYGNNLYLDNINITANMVGVHELNENSSLSVFPNPANSVLNIQTTSAENEKITISICDMTGNVIQSKEAFTTVGQNYFTLDISTMSEGIYLVHVEENGVIRTKKISVVR